MEEYKRPLESIKLIKSLSEDYHLVVIGDGAKKDELIEAARSGGMNLKLSFYEKISHSKIHFFYKAADFFVNFNCNEIFGMSILEAMYHECTVVAFKAPGPNDIIEDNVSGYLVSNRSQMIERINKARSTGLEAKIRVEKHFNWDSIACSFLNEMGGKFNG